MTLPRGDEYNQAIQNPKIAFTDTELKSSLVETTPLGLPKPYSGGFTITYKLIHNQSGWAVRCFHRDIQDLQKRYQAVGNFLAKTKSQYFVQAQYLENGIKVNGKGFPIIKMQWLEGEPLNIYLSKNYTQRSKVEKLITDFIGLIAELEKYGIAHGDIQHGNIIVKNDKLYLIDYDGMFFPELASLTTNEIGHINYQHPKRSASHYNQNIDRFSAIIIYIGLKAVSINPNLWKRHDNSENILFKSQDYADLQNSILIQEISLIPELKPLIERLIGLCYLDFEKVPSLKDFLAGTFIYDKNIVGKISISRSQYLVLDGSKSSSILEHFGEKVEIVGRIDAFRSAKTRLGKPYVFLNFGVWPNQTFTLVVWSEGLAALQQNNISPESLKNKWISVTGVVSSYENKPQMTVEVAAQIQLLSNEEEAKSRLKLKPVTSNVGSTTIKKTADKEVDVFNSLYGNRPVTPQKNKVPVSNTSQNSNTPKTTYSNTPSQTTKTKTNTTTKSNSGNNGCVLPIILAVIGAIVIGAASNGKLWFVGAIGGGVLGAWVQNWFK